jgi:selenide,water dikinase
MCRLNRVASEAAGTFGAHAMTDITGFGLVGHAGEMALASGVTLAIDVDSLPILRGAEELGRKGFRTRASRSNRAFAEALMRIEGDPDPDRLALCFDPQTSGGLLISVPPESLEDVQQYLVDRGEPRPACVGEVRAQEDSRLVLR